MLYRPKQRVEAQQWFGQTHPAIRVVHPSIMFSKCEQYAFLRCSEVMASRWVRVDQKPGFVWFADAWWRGIEIGHEVMLMNSADFAQHRELVSWLAKDLGPKLKVKPEPWGSLTDAIDGHVMVHPGDYVVKVAGGHRVIKPKDFEAVWEPDIESVDA